MTKISVESRPAPQGALRLVTATRGSQRSGVRFEAAYCSNLDKGGS